jgi:hypothetical protein
MERSGEMKCLRELAHSLDCPAATALDTRASLEKKTGGRQRLFDPPDALHSLS